MKGMRQFFYVVIVIAIASQISFSVFEADFRISAGVVFFALFLVGYQNLKPISLGIISGLAIYGLRILIYYLGHGRIQEVWISYQIEILFYLFYGILFWALRRRIDQDNLNHLAIVFFFCDLGANLVEVFSRMLFTSTFFDNEITVTLLSVALIRSALIWTVLNGLRSYKRLLLKEEHEVRYARLVWLSAQLKSEMYWMEKNMEEIEKVMTNSYTLFENIKFDQRRDDWGEQAVAIARDVHEIKKEYALAVRGIKELTMDEMVEGGMEFKDICRILHDSMKREIRSLKSKIDLTFESGENFYTSRHYYLMSILRNLIMNSIDAIETSAEAGKIRLVHETDPINHYFEVSDTGPGIEAEDLGSVFSPGFSTKINYATGQINRGLGLSVVQNIIEKELHGKIEVVSVKGTGTTFRMTISRADLEEIK